MSLPLLDLVVLALLLGVLPLASVAQMRVVAGLEIERVPAYLSSVATLVVLGVGAWLAGTRNGGAEALGLGAVPVGPVAAWTVVLVLSGLALVMVFRRGAMALGAGESPMLRALLPRTARERGIFAVLSLAAGVAEEIAYRGYALTVVATVTGAGWAAVATSVVFGVLHAYQGWLGVLRTGALGGLLAWGYLASGSLWAPMAAHAILDLLLGIALGERVMVPETESGVTVSSDGESAPPREEHGSGSGASR
ncbi:MAG TPA: CPBP family intramembrane glutamic endopeptidase [Longimicrobiales bacterium]|nr:CPBP family intramembrane glutamic endopeptidase [Longimicrobiales bacterium]